VQATNKMRWCTNGAVAVDPSRQTFMDDAQPQS
jgi:hypothetical protein